MTVPVAYLAGGRLHVKEGDDEPRAFDSKFGQTVRDRAVRSAQKNAWKTQGTGAQFMSGGATLWGAKASDPGVLRIAITGLSRAAEPGRLLYALDTDEIVGLFSLDPGTGEEKRLFHSNDHRVRFPSSRPGQDRVVCSVYAEGGTAGVANLALMRADGSDLREITEGESLDLAPSWAPEGARIVYQTAGLGRDRQGRLVGFSPFSVQFLDLETGDITPVLDDARFDFLGPRIARDGAVYAIRRPHRARGGGSPWKAAADVGLFPFRIVRAFLGYLNFFSVRYSGKPLSSAGGARQKEADPRQMLIWGNLIDAEKAAQRAREGGDATPALVPPSWKLVRKRAGAADVEELASGVLSFDLADDGSVVLSNGSAVDHLAPDGKRTTLCRGELIEQVVALG